MISDIKDMLIEVWSKPNLLGKLLTIATPVTLAVLLVTQTLLGISLALLTFAGLICAAMSRQKQTRRSRPSDDDHR